MLSLKVSAAKGKGVTEVEEEEEEVEGEEAVAAPSTNGAALTTVPSQAMGSRARGDKDPGTSTPDEEGEMETGGTEEARVREAIEEVEEEEEGEGDRGVEVDQIKEGNKWLSRIPLRARSRGISLAPSPTKEQETVEAINPMVVVHKTSLHRRSCKTMLYM